MFIMHQLSPVYLWCTFSYANFVPKEIFVANLYHNCKWIDKLYTYDKGNNCMEHTTF